MLYYLTNTFQGWLGDSVYWVIQIFTEFHFRAFAALIFSFLFVLVFGPRTIKRLQELKVSDHPETFNTELNTLNQAKKGTPTMGGVLICGSIRLGHARRSVPQGEAAVPDRNRHAGHVLPVPVECCGG